MNQTGSAPMKVGVVALGYVGLPLVRAFWEAGAAVLGFDTDPEKVAMLNRGENYLPHLGEDLVREMVRADKGPMSGGGGGEGRFEATGDMERLGEPEVLIVCVPTPLGPHLEPDLSFVERTAEAIGRTLRPGQLVVLESTTYPGTTREVVLPRLERGGGEGDAAGARERGAMVCGRDFHLAYSPEREDPGRAGTSTRTIPKLVGGIDEASAKRAVEVYRPVVETVIPVSSAEVAEAAKILENIYRSVNIALVNELKMILTKMNIDVWEVIDAASTKPFGFQRFDPGPGLGGHCIPIDPFYLTWKAREVGEVTRFIELAGHVNSRMPEWVVHRTMLALNDRGRAVRGSRVLVLGLSYKPNVADTRESPSFEIIERLEGLGAAVDYHDPHVPATRPMRAYDLQKQSIELSARAVAGYDAVVIATHHGAYDWSMIGEQAQVVIDTRGVMRGAEVAGAEGQANGGGNVVSA